jgi:HemY protein
LKSFARFLFVLMLALGLGFALTQESGQARIVWHGIVVETSVAFLCVVIVVLIFTTHLFLHFFHIVRHGPAMWSSGRRLRQMRLGHDHLTAGFIAIASGNAGEAGRRSIAARKSLGTTAMTQFLQAQAAQMAGDHKASRGLFRSLADDPDSAVLGYRGLIMAARRQGNSAEMEGLIDELRHLKGDVPWIQVISFDLAVLGHKWDIAGALLAQPALSRVLGVEHVRRARAALLMMAAENEIGKGDMRRALLAAEQAMKQASDWVPAIITLAKIQIATGHRRAAQRMIEKHWGQVAHPYLATLYVGEEKTPLNIYRATEKLCEANIDSAVSHRVMAAAALQADLWGEAWRHLQILVNRGQATQGTYAMLQQLAKRVKNIEASQWYDQALKAVPDQTWLCSACGGAHAEWQASCGHCNSFLSLEWQSPGVSRHTEAAQPFLPSYAATEWMS